MNFNTAAGIELTNEQIHLAVLKQSKAGVQLLKSATMPMPEGALTAGNIKNPIAIAKAVKDLCGKNNVSSKNLVISLLATPTLMRIIDLPKDFTGTPTQFVHDELKHYAMLAGKNIAQDFCSISTNKQLSTARVLAVATDEEKVSSLVKAFNRFGFAIKVIEPNVIASIRALHAKNLKRFDSNSILVFSQGEVTTICVFRNGHFDFIRSINLIAKELEQQQGVTSLIEEINSVRQFYDLEIEEGQKKWELVIHSDNINVELLKISLDATWPGLAVTYCEPGADYKVLSINDAQGKTVSITAVGLAMRQLTNPGELKVNMVPPRTDEIHNMQIYALLCLNAAAAVFLAVLLAVPVLKSKLKEAHTIVVQKKTICNMDINGLSKKQIMLDEQSKNLTEELAQVSELAKVNTARDWAGLLAEIGIKTPKQLRITSLTAKDDRTVILTGQALSNDEVHAFAKRLTKSSLIYSASLVKTEEDSILSNLISYTISCTLPELKGSHANAN